MLIAIDNKLIALLKSTDFDKIHNLEKLKTKVSDKLDEYTNS